MKYEKSAGAVVFREFVGPEKGLTLKGLNPIKREYLLLAHTSMGKEKKIIWDFPKGLVAEAESERKTAEREIAEETGLSEFSFVEGFRETLKIFFKLEGEFINKTIIYFLVQTTGGEVTISFEHTGFEWLELEEALKRLSFKNSREILEKAEKFLNGQEISNQPKLI